MTNRKKRIEKTLKLNFKKSFIEVQDISFKHAGHNNFTGNQETHFLIIFENLDLINLKRIDIHRKINTLLKEEFDSGLHALEIKIKN
tara:strand:- start:6536 stop:6796 length:261 start_codon:yes stop_codon:yes gene_type:complete